MEVSGAGSCGSPEMEVMCRNEVRAAGWSSRARAAAKPAATEWGRTDVMGGKDEEASEQCFTVSN